MKFIHYLEKISGVSIYALTSFMIFGLFFMAAMEWDTAAAHAILNACNRGVYKTDLSAELSYNKPDLKNPFFIAF